MMPDPTCRAIQKTAMQMSEHAKLVKRWALDMETTSQNMMTGQVDCFYPFKKLAAEGLLNMARSLHRLSWRFSDSAWEYAQKAKSCYLDESWSHYKESDEPVSKFW